jgi:phosphopantetheine adenylyltransferase
MSETVPIETLKLAKRLALTYVNENRVQKGIKPLQRLTVDWWKNYGQEFIDKAIEESKK